ncbi:FAD-dependent oxidoreductase [uncultured Acinetobacter sp.]|uniref:NAD(P)/FAD-dependent oxidoreductase n=1 Tax=uncultured Acinetobacter sp. TaxID=165433 RepID=UPI0026077C79|nr:FAD-dependent oxidoreductase [uncultured Acinetobacter sp.]
MKSIVIYGGGMAGTFLAKKLCQSFAVTLVDSNDYFEIPMATPRSIVDANFAEQAIIPFQQALPKVQHIQGHLIQLNPDYTGIVRLKTGQEIQLHADVSVIATGSHFCNALVRGESQSKLQRQNFYQDFSAAIKKAQAIVLVGGGPIGVELAGEINELYPQKNITIIESQTRLVSGTTAKVSTYIQQDFKRRGIHVLLNTQLVQASHSKDTLCTEAGVAMTADGQQIAYDLLVWCIGGRANTTYLQAHFGDLLNQRAQVQVESTLQVKNHPRLFALGDITDLAENKMAWHINGQIPVAAHNIRCLLEDQPHALKTYKAKTNNPMMAITLGRQKGVVYLPIVGMINVPFLTRMAKASHMLVPKYRKELGL